MLDLDALAAQVKELRITNKPEAGKILDTVKPYLIARKGDGAPMWSRWVQSMHLDWKQLETCLHAFDPVKYPKKPKADRRRPTEKTSAGELHEASRGFKAMMDKAAREEDIAMSRKRRTVAFQHFKFLLSKSDLPSLMNMTPDQIIDLVRKI
jgi:hypothetical protein